MKRPRRTVLVAGNGMVGLRFCRELTDRAPDRFDITVLAEEDVPAYDRVRLTRLLRGRSFEDLVLEPRSWYETRSIDLELADAAVAIDRARTLVRTRRGRTLSYDTLVLATGAASARPPIPGIDLPGVLPYRTATDLLAVQLRAARSSRALVLGGGLIGVEVATALLALGLDTAVIESGPHLLHRQLDRPGAEIVRAELERQGARVVTGQRVRAIHARGQRLAVELERGAAPPGTCRDNERGRFTLVEGDLVVMAAGARPRDELAREAGLAVDETRGGVLVDDQLATSDPRVLAIGDCARWSGEAPAYLAPGYRMAEIAARRLAGETARFTGEPTAIRLSVAGIEVAALGDHAGGGRRLVFHDGGIRRGIVLRDGRVAGVSAVGPWDALPELESAMRARRRLSSAEIARFCRSGEPWPATRHATRSDADLLCHCAGVSCGAVRAAMARGCASVSTISAATGAGASCGSCRPALVQLLAAGGVTSIRPGQDRVPPRGRWLMALVSLLALIACGGFALAGRSIAAAGAEAARWLLDLPGASSKVVSGFVLVGTASLGLLLSVRKRIPRWRRAARGMSGWRLLHATVGLAALAVLVGHTGMRTGDNLNQALLVAFLGVIASGATVGIAAASPGIARATPVLLWGHLALLWVLPVLVTFHVIAVYWF
ncbi:MAG TPA: FAD-dependent oxidoreductase [Kofleriaceae bacterium]|nr:FAD-dependent oxidoreductase [Kofleriaceae bacterium]